jgi:hypothetical protein
MVTGTCIIAAAASILRKKGYSKKRIETIFLALPLFIVTICFTLAMLGMGGDADDTDGGNDFDES